MSTASPFLDVPGREWVASNAHAFAIRDRYPVSAGHTLIVPRRLVATWFEADATERSAILALVDEVKAALDREYKPDGYNVGFNAGAAAGQTVMHLHVHVIPRYVGDVDDPRGGIRGAIPAKQKYSALLSADPVRDRPVFGDLPRFVYGSDNHLEVALRDALLQADHADLVSAFVQASGVSLLLGDLRDALQRGTMIRLIAGDYLGISNADALRMLHRLAEEHATFHPFFFETAGAVSFHPKSYIFRRGAHGVAYIGSSNISRSALRDGVEWNLRLVSSEDAETFAAIRARFEHLLASESTKPLTRALIDAYEARAPVPALPAPEGRSPPPMPNQVQREALDALRATRREGHTKGLVVLATGLGKTYLSAFDFKSVGGERALFIAHREEILEQAKDAWQTVFPDKVVGAYRGDARDLDVDLLFASVQTVSRAKHLSRFTPEYFDYIVVDEFHHAAAPTYRKLLGHFHPRFLLGLTATPERTDGRSLLELCGDNLVFRRDLIHGISKQLLVPFQYFGVRDGVDFEPIPWRSGKFDADQLTAAVATEERAEQSLREYERRAAGGVRRTLCFCATVAHAEFMAAFFCRRGKRAVAVHSGAGSAPRAGSVRELKAGALEIICAVDVFNEGLDVPDINTVLMLRPTESPIVFLQQLGRGLRRAEGKRELRVIDFIGNHRSFLTKPQALLFLLGADLPPQVAIEKIREGSLELPPGCSINIETEAIDLLRSMVRVSAADTAIYEYASFRDAHGRRPTAAELFAEGVAFKPIRDAHNSWFHFVQAQGDLTDDEAAALTGHESWWSDLLRTRMEKAYKMLALRALLDADRLFSGMEIADNARRAFESVRDELLFFREMREDEDRRAFTAAFIRKWAELPLKVWANGEGTTARWFQIEGDAFVPTFDVSPAERDVFEAMTEEMVELRLAEHKDRLLRRQRIDASQAPIVLTVSHSNHRPILRFDRTRRADVPIGATLVEVGGEMLTFDFKKIAVNVAQREGSATNVLPEVLRALFGPSTGQPGIRHRAKLVRGEGGWQLTPDDGRATGAATDDAAVDRDPMNVIPFPTLDFFADVRVACGAFEGATQHADTIERIAVQTDASVNPKKHFVVRASGDSMNGGDAPIADGDLVLCEWTRGLSEDQIRNAKQPFLLVGHDAADTSFAVMKVPRKSKDGWLLESWNSAFPPQKIPPHTKLEPVARVLGIVEEAMGLTLYGTYDRDAIAAAFGSGNNPSWKVGHRDIDVAGVPHTVLMVTLRKSSQTKMEHRYADRFLSANEFQWESQASTTADSLKGRRIRMHVAERRTLHLFVQYDSHQNFTYLGPVTYRSHEGDKPMRVRFALAEPLPPALWKMWS